MVDVALWFPRGVRVLLMSPVDGHDVAGGDIAYTEALLARPPEGVTYTTYIDALEGGTMTLRGIHPRNGIAGGPDLAILGARAVEKGFRRSGIPFRESLRYITVDPDHFDLIHAHTFPVRQVSSRVPLVTSSGFPLPVLYRDRFGWSQRHVDVAAKFERILAATVGGDVPWLPPRRAARTMVQSEHYRRYLEAAGARPDRIAVRTLGIEGSASSARSGPPRTIGFIATGFESKGGQVVLDAFRILQGHDPDVRLVVVGSIPEGGVRPSDTGITWAGRVPRDEVLNDLLPAIDVLVHPTPCDSGPPYVILEALQRGIPVVASDLAWLDEGLIGPGARRVPRDGAAVAAAVADLFNPDTYPMSSQAAIDLWGSRYTMEVLAELIGQCYQDALAGGAVRAGSSGTGGSRARRR